MSLEIFWKDVLQRKRARFLLPLFYVLSLGYKGVLQLRNFCFDHGLFKVHTVPIPVISIGNIAVGGSGKTPLTMLLAKQLSRFGKVAILSRGYKSVAANKKASLLVDASMTACQIGDEPKLMSSKLKDVKVYVCPDRYLSALQGMEDDCEYIILDDGFQHRRLGRDFDLVMVDAEDPLCNNKLLPIGRLRDLPSRLKKADLIIAKTANASFDFLQLQSFVKNISNASLVGVLTRIDTDFLPKKVGVFTAIAQPELFIQMLKDKGIATEISLFKEDHGSFSEKELETFSSELMKKDVDMLVCTEKDGIKLPSDLKQKFNVKEIPLSMEITFNKDAWEEMIEKIAQKKVDFIEKSKGNA